MHHIIKILFACLTLVSCADPVNHHLSGKTPHQEKVHQPKTPKKHPAATGTFNDTLVLDQAVAVFISPSTQRINQAKKEMGEENFLTGADDYIYYMSTAQDFLDSMKLKIVQAGDKKFIAFVRSDKTRQLLRVGDVEELWSIYFFTPSKAPRQVDMTDIQEEYNNYFK